MKHFKTIIPVYVIVFLLGTVASSWAALTGSITYGTNGNGGLYASGDNWAKPASTLSWNVYQLTSGVNAGEYEYDYTLALASNARNISHVIIQTSANFSSTDIFSGTTFYGDSTKLQLNTWSDNGQGNSNSGIPASLYGLKWDLSSLAVNNYTWTLVTDRAPTQGNFYARDGSGVYAFSGTSNAGVGVFGNEVVTPDSVTPLPAAAWLLGSGLMGLIGIRRKNL